MLYIRKRAERLAREARDAFEAQVEAARLGTVFAFNAKAFASYRSARAAASSAPPQSVEGYKATLTRLGALMNGSKPLGLVN